MALSSSAAGRLRLFGTARGKIIHLNTSSARGVLRLHGRATPRIPGTKISTGAKGYLLLKGTAKGFVNAPYGSFRDFSHYPENAVDPAMALVSIHNGGGTSSDVSQVAGYRRYYAIAAAPTDYAVSGGDKAWSRAAYVSVGLKFKGLASNGYQYLSNAQFEIAKYAAVLPATYQPARRINTSVTAQHVNFAANPAAIMSDGTVTTLAGPMPKVTRFGTGTDAVAWRATDRLYIGINSVGIDWTAPDGSVAYAGYDVSGLTIGTSYVALLMVWREPDAPEVAITADKVTFGNSVTRFEQWVESRVTFTATATTQRVGLVRADAKTGRTYIGGVVCTEAPYVGGYFDGSSGPDFAWTGVVNSSSSLYFPDKVIRSYLLSQLLAENCPLGVTPGVPQFGAVSSLWSLGDPQRSVLGVSTYL